MRSAIGRGVSQRDQSAARSRSELGSEIFTHTLAPGGVRPIRPKRAAMIVRALPLRSRARRSERVGFRSRIITCLRAPEAVRGHRHDSGVRQWLIGVSARKGLSAHLLSSVAIARDADSVISILLQRRSSPPPARAMRSHMKYSGPLKSARQKLYLPSLRRVVHTRERSGEVSGREPSWRAVIRREEGIDVVHDVCQT